MKNRYFLLRHGEAVSNVKDLISCYPEKFYSPLTEKGKRKIKNQIKNLKKKKIDLIFSSDLLRTRQTAEIIGRELGLKPEYDKRLREFNVGIFNGRSTKEIHRFFSKEINRFKIRPPGGENYTNIKKRMCQFLKDIDKKYSGKTILIISHEVPLTILVGVIRGFSNQEILKYRKKSKIEVGELRKLI